MVFTFTAEDPLWAPAALQSYTYVNNNPITFRDPLGLQQERHPPSGIRFRCYPGDPCELLKVKIKVYEAFITLHQALDAATGNLDSQGRPEHTTEINELRNGLNRCWDYYKAQKCDCDPPRVDQPMTQQQWQQLQQLLGYLFTLTLMMAALAAWIVYG